MEEKNGRPGPKAWYGPKGDPMSLAITDEARDLLDETCKAQQVSRADIFEQLIRRFRHKVRRPRCQQSS